MKLASAICATLSLALLWSSAAAHAQTNHIFETNRLLRAYHYRAAAPTDWLQTYAYGAGAVTGLDNSAPIHVLESTGVAGAARASDFPNAGPSTAIIGTIGWGFCDGTAASGSADTPCWGHYAEGRAYPGTTGFAAGTEINITNGRGSYTPINPYNWAAAGATFGLHIASGGGCTELTPCYDPSTGKNDLVAGTASNFLLISPNSASAASGIIFGTGSIAPTGGAIPAIELPENYQEIWYAPNGTIAGLVYADSNGNLNLDTVGTVIVNGSVGVTCFGPPTQLFAVTDGHVTHC
jgi:hypothetical protein